jgi:hypothetical protein
MRHGFHAVPCLPGQVATVTQSEQFLAAYNHASGPRPIATLERGRPGCGSAPLMSRTASLVGAGPTAALTKAEAKETSRLARAVTKRRQSPCSRSSPAIAEGWCTA